MSGKRDLRPIVEAPGTTLRREGANTNLLNQ
jgi:hypothetical protein